MLDCVRGFCIIQTEMKTGGSDYEALESVFWCYGNNIDKLDLSKNEMLVKAVRKGKDYFEEYYRRYKHKFPVPGAKGYWLGNVEIVFDASTEMTANGKTLYAPPRTTVSIKKCKISDIADQTYTG